MKTVTLADIRSWGPCYDPSKWITTEWSGTALDILKMDLIPPKDRFWAVLRIGMISDQIMRRFACDCADRVLHIFETEFPRDNRPRRVIEISRRYIIGLATRGELNYARDEAWAARTAARGNGSPAYHAAWAAWGTACHAAWSSAWEAVWDAGASWPTDTSWQINHLISMIVGE
jgi:hypothetical protein